MQPHGGFAVGFLTKLRKFLLHFHKPTGIRETFLYQEGSKPLLMSCVAAIWL